MAGSTARADHRRRSRRRGEALNDAIYAAVLAELSECGYTGLTMEGVAERAQAGKASLYRRWSSKIELVMAAVYHQLPGPEALADTGTLRGDLIAMLRSAAESLEGPAGQAMRGIISDVLRDDARANEIRAHARGTSMRAMREVVRRAGRRGEVRAEAVTERQLETGHALLRYHFLTHGGPISERAITEIVDEVVLPVLRHASD